ncbi:recombinase family protein [Limnohabitans sp. JirII-31]|uniref:recombinase family protein n=1 Tax=Limnohabitans sp. JirII-31 TaxID=1977908 RepID=UPI000C1DF95F|nr:recombinase family protein [Limnohabitans sp. JirII-31]PIT76690.1 recombinase [Limnohabitans sp. JirII-31]
MNTIAPKRCAVYCRVSSDERLDQSFNSIDAQREAGIAYVASQKTEGWELVPDFYEDPGFSGGNMERPGLKRLLKDIQAGKIDIVVVYKIDRLSRSLADFAKMVEVFDNHMVSFSSVTQQINSATSMGRLMLNVLLSFAQFEREVTGERIRDKIAASKRKGMWMGGSVPLGYRVENRALHINPEEAELVQRIFEQFIAEQSTTKIVKELNEQGIQTKRKKAFCKQSIYKILHNRNYIGEISHKGESFPAQHERLIDQITWERTHAILSQDNRQRCKNVWEKKNRNDFLLRGIAYTQDGDLLIPMATKKPNGKLYRYYVINKKIHNGAEAAQSWNYQAAMLEDVVSEKLLEYLRSELMVDKYWSEIQKINPSIDEPQAVVLILRHTASIWDQFFTKMKTEIIHALIKRVVIKPDGIEVQMRFEGLGAVVKAMQSQVPQLEVA